MVGSCWVCGVCRVRCMWNMLLFIWGVVWVVRVWFVMFRVVGVLSSCFVVGVVFRELYVISSVDNRGNRCFMNLLYGVGLIKICFLEGVSFEDRELLGLLISLSDQFDLLVQFWCGDYVVGGCVGEEGVVQVVGVGVYVVQYDGFVVGGGVYGGVVVYVQGVVDVGVGVLGQWVDDVQVIDGVVDCQNYVYGVVVGVGFDCFGQCGLGVVFDYVVGVGFVGSVYSCLIVGGQVGGVEYGLSYVVVVDVYWGFEVQGLIVVEII